MSPCWSRTSTSTLCGWRSRKRLSLSNNNLNVAVLVANLHIYFVWLALKKEIDTLAAYLKFLDRKLWNARRQVGLIENNSLIRSFDRDTQTCLHNEESGGCGPGLGRARNR